MSIPMRGPRNKIAINIKGPYGRILSINLAQEGGKKYWTTFSPSRGATGIRLNNINARFITMNSNRKPDKVGNKPEEAVYEINPARSGITASRAKSRFDKGPARETHITAAGDLLFNAYGLIGTGFAHPKPANSSIKVPIRSRCAVGLSVSRPFILGVSSPKALATKACENSCTEKAISNVMIRDMIVAGVKLNIFP